ncbi:MAG: tetratricopeptide repeat protein [Acidobacteria bacterium]|nr:tetratricopeptide repeat protein [Acidobacteriota bacterium]
MKTAALSLLFASLLCAQVESDPSVSPTLRMALDLARENYHATNYQAALRIIEMGEPKIPGQWALIGQCYFQMGEYKKAISALEQATKAAPKSSSDWNWLGKAYGRQAETGFKLSAPSNASKARQHFEKAVALDPANLEAVDDLFEYFLEAPGFLGGGVDKAAKLAETIRAKSPAKYEALQARMAGKKKDVAAAEQHWRKAAELAPAEPGALVNLAQHLARNGKTVEADQLFDKAITGGQPFVKFERAKILAEGKRDTAKAKQLLNEYLKADLTADDPPRSEAQKLLASLSK